MLEQHQAQQLRAAGAERRADGQLAAAGHAGGEQQVGDVGARDEEQQHDTRRHRDERRLHGGHRLVEHPHELHLHRPPLAEEQIVDERARDAARSRGPFRRRLLDRRARPEPRDGGEDAHFRLVRRRDEPDLRRPQARLRGGEGEAGRRHPDDLVVAIVEAHVGADGVGAAAEPLHPEAMAQDDDPVLARFFLGLVEEPAHERLHPQDGEHAGTELAAADAIGTVRRRPQIPAVAVRGWPLDCPGSAPGCHGGGADDAADPAAGARPVFGDEQQLFGVGIGERAQQHAVDDGNQRGREPQAQGERQERRRGAAAAVSQRADRLSKLGLERGHGRSTSQGPYPAQLRWLRHLTDDGPAAIVRLLHWL